MKEYRVEITKAAEDAIYEHVRYIAVEKQEPDNAKRWLQVTLAAVQTLKAMPNRCSPAEENEDVEYEVRQLVVGGPSLLLHVDEEEQIVWVFAFRGQGQLARKLPTSLDAVRKRREVRRMDRQLGTCSPRA